MTVNFNSYMRKLKHRFKVTKDECGVYYLEGRFGKRASGLGKDECLARIAPYDPENGVLGVWVTGLSPAMATKRLNKLRPLLKDVDACEDGFIGHFKEQHLDRVCEVIGVKKRQAWPEARKQAAAARMRLVRELRGKDQSARPSLF
jgi:hypothetical protein